MTEAKKKTDGGRKVWKGRYGRGQTRKMIVEKKGRKKGKKGGRRRKTRGQREGYRREIQNDGNKKAKAGRRKIWKRRYGRGQRVKGR